MGRERWLYLGIAVTSLLAACGSDDEPAAAPKTSTESSRNAVTASTAPALVAAPARTAVTPFGGTCPNRLVAQVTVSLESQTAEPPRADTFSNDLICVWNSGDGEIRVVANRERPDAEFAEYRFSFFGSTLDVSVPGADGAEAEVRGTELIVSILVGDVICTARQQGATLASDGSAEPQVLAFVASLAGATCGLTTDDAEPAERAAEPRASVTTSEGPEPDDDASPTGMPDIEAATDLLNRAAGDCVSYMGQGAGVESVGYMECVRAVVLGDIGDFPLLYEPVDVSTYQPSEVELALQMLDDGWRPA